MTPDEARFVRPYVPPVSAAPVPPVSAVPVSPPAVVEGPAPPKPPTFRRRTVRGTAAVPSPGVVDAGVPDGAPATSRRRVVGVIIVLALVAAGLTAYLARPRAVPVAGPAAQPTDYYLPTAGAVGGVAGSQVVTSQGARATPSASHSASVSTRPPSFVAGPPVAPATTGPSPSVNPAGNDLALGKPTAASSTEADAWDARYAVDGDTGTRWGSQWSDPQWIRVDLGGLWSVSHVTLRWETAHATRYTIQTSTDGTTWTVVTSVDNGDGGVDDVAFAPTAARYVMMLGTHRSSGYGYSLWEFEVR